MSNCEPLFGIKKKKTMSFKRDGDDIDQLGVLRVCIECIVLNFSISNDWFYFKCLKINDE